MITSASGIKTTQTQFSTQATSKLSDKAKALLENLKKENEDFDFFVMEEGDDAKSLLSQSTKEFSVVFSNEELEKMANDDDYTQKKLESIRNIVKMSDKINEQFGFKRAFGEGPQVGESINKISVSFDENGQMSIFAELEKLNEKQMEWINKIKEEKAEEKEEAQKEEALGGVKRVTVEASSERELFDKIQKIDWEKVAEINTGYKPIISKLV